MKGGLVAVAFFFSAAVRGDQAEGLKELGQDAQQLDTTVLTEEEQRVLAKAQEKLMAEARAAMFSFEGFTAEDKNMKGSIKMLLGKESQQVPYNKNEQV